MTWYPACAATPEDDGPNFDPPVMGNGLGATIRRLREAEVFATVSREAREFHERKARKYGVNTPRGLAHFKAAKSFAREGGRLQEMFENGGELGELPPKAIMNANKAAIGFHKKQAEKAGLDSDVGHAHIAAMEHHMDIHNKAKQQHQAGKQQKMQAAAPGHTGKQSPVPVPKKSDQPSEDVRQNLPPVPLRRLQQGGETMGAHAGRIRMSTEGGPGSGPQGGRKERSDKGKKWSPQTDPNIAGKKEAMHEHYRQASHHENKANSLFEGGNKEEEAKHNRLAEYHREQGDKLRKEIGWNPSKESLRRGHEAVGSKPGNLEDCFPRPVKKLMRPDLVFKGKRLKMHSGRKGQEAGGQGMVAQRYDQSHPEGFTSPQYADLQHGTESRKRKGWPARQKDMHRRMSHRHSMESRRDEDGPTSIDLKSLYTAPSRGDGWAGGGISYSPKVRQRNSVTNGVTIKEF